MLVDELLHCHEAAADSDHEDPIDDLGRDYLGAEEVLARVNAVDGDLDLVSLDEFLKHLVDHIVVDACVHDLLGKRVTRTWLRGLLAKPVHNVSHRALQSLGLLQGTGPYHRLLLGLKRLEELIDIREMRLSLLWRQNFDILLNLVLHLLLVKHEILLLLLLLFWHWEGTASLVLRRSDPKASVFTITVWEVGLHVFEGLVLFLNSI